MVAVLKNMNTTTTQHSFDSTCGRVAYTDSATGEATVILMHGLPTSKELWNPVLPLLDARLRVITFDLNQYGQSEQTARHITHQERADVLDELRRHLRVERFALVAHDLGASVALDYMGRHAPHVARLVLMSPPAFPDYREPLLVRVMRLPGVGELTVRLMKRTLFKIGIGRGMVHTTRMTPELIDAFADPFDGALGRATLLRLLRWGRPRDVFKDYPRIAASIDVPTLILHGRRDPYIPPTQATRLHQLINASKVIIIEDGAHFLPLDTPAPVACAINEHVLGAKHE